ncbi:MAG: PilW family protein [Magnetococcales bacterium]|nr:PilW family protein [Magnetococcales bacterium]
MALISRQAPLQAGVSLVEVMISMTIGLVILLAIISMLASSSRTQKEMDQASQIVGNGNFAINELYDNLRNAGYFGHYFFNAQSYSGAALPDPCDVSDHAALLNALAMPVQGYAPASLTTRVDFTGTDCAALLTSANLQPGSDVLVLRRADTVALTGAYVANEIYLQSNVLIAGLRKNDAITHTVQNNAVSAGSVAITQLDGSPAEIRKLHVDLYFVAPCSVGSGAGGICTSGDDTIPTLKRLELSVSGGATAMVVTPLAEGVEYMKLLYGIDNNPSTVDSATGLIGDGNPDTFVAAPVLTEWRSVIAVQVHLLVRSPESALDHVDNKSYLLAGNAIAARNDAFKRHVFSSEVRLVNLAGPRSTE